MRLLFFVISLSLCVQACRKAEMSVVENTATCIPQYDNPHLRTYSTDSITGAGIIYKHCGLLPLCGANRWVYRDSLYVNGVFSSTQLDTLQFTPAYRTPDGLTWWSNDKYLGLPALLYANDSSLFNMEKRLFAVPEVMAARREYHVFAEDSVRYITSFSDVGAIGKAVKQQNPTITPAGVFNQCILFEKYAPGSRREQIWFQPGIGVIRFRYELPGPGGQLQVRRISTLVAVYLN